MQNLLRMISGIGRLLIKCAPMARSACAQLITLSKRLLLSTGSKNLKQRLLYFLFRLLTAVLAVLNPLTNIMERSGAVKLWNVLKNLAKEKNLRSKSKVKKVISFWWSC